MKTNSNSKKKVQRKHYPLRPGLLTNLGMAILLIVGLSLSFAPQEAYGQQPETIKNGLLYLESDAPGQSKIIHKSQPLNSEESTIAEPFIPAGCKPLGLYASPHGPWLAISVTCEASGFVQVINVTTGKAVELDPYLTHDSYFLNWSQTGNEIILGVGDLPNSGINLVQINSGKYEQLPVPSNVYDVALSVNGKRMIYSLTWGLGYGSETWIADIDGGNAQRVLMEPDNIIAYAQWSPNGKEIAYLRMPDSNIPFTIGELWLMESNGQNPVLLGNADAGHGYRPAWSPDGQQIAFVVREPASNDADMESEAASYAADKLVSNIYLANINDRKISQLTQFGGSVTENPVWSPDGHYISFSSTAGGSGMDVWMFETRNGQLNQVTHGASARHPAWLSNP